MTVVVAVGAIVRLATPATKSSLSNVLALDVTFAGVEQPVTAGVQVNVTVPERNAPELPPEEDAEPLKVSTPAVNVTVVPEATVILVPAGIVGVPAITAVVVGAATTVKATGVGAVLVPVAHVPTVGQ